MWYGGCCHPDGGNQEVDVRDEGVQGSMSVWEWVVGSIWMYISGTTPRVRSVWKETAIAGFNAA